MSSSAKTQRLIDLLAVLSGRRRPVTLKEILDRVPGYALPRPDGSERTRASVRRAFERDKDDLRSLGVPIEAVEIPGGAGSEDQAGYRLSERDFYLPYLRLLKRRKADGEGLPGPAGRLRMEGTDGTGGTEGTEGTEPRPRWPGRAGEPRRRWSTSRAGSSGATFEIHEAEATAALDALAHLCALPDFPLARHARAAFRKLALDLDPVALLGPAVLTPGPPGDPVPGTRMETLVRAVIEGKRLSFRYRGIERNDDRIRTVEPYGLFTRFGRWYLAARDADRDTDRDTDRDAVRVFRADRMDEVSVKSGASGGPDFEAPDGFDLSALAGRDPWELDRSGSDPRQVSLRFHTPFARWAARRQLGVEPREDDGGSDGGSTLGSRTVAAPEALVRWVLGLAGGAEILGPPEVAAEARRAAVRVARIHADEIREEPGGEPGQEHRGERGGAHGGGGPAHGEHPRPTGGTER